MFQLQVIDKVTQCRWKGLDRSGFGHLYHGYTNLGGLGSVSAPGFSIKNDKSGIVSNFFERFKVGNARIIKMAPVRDLEFFGAVTIFHSCVCDELRTESFQKRRESVNRARDEV